MEIFIKENGFKNKKPAIGLFCFKNEDYFKIQNNYNAHNKTYGIINLNLNDDFYFEILIMIKKGLKKELN